MDAKTEGSDSGEVKSSPISVFKMLKKSCIDCHTTRTPLWRGGPAGPRPLCNACGIRHRKTKRTLSALDKGKEKAENRKRKNNKNVVSLKMGLTAASAGRQLALLEFLEEEEEDATLLMSLSYGYIDA